jgi:hypothetical protein
MDVEGDGNANHKATPPPASNMPTTAATGAAAGGGGGEGPSDTPAFNVDVCFEASKLPLDVGIFNSVRAAGGDEKIRKYLQAVLVVGGTALIPGMAHALESRCVWSQPVSFMTNMHWFFFFFFKKKGCSQLLTSSSLR